MALARDVEWVPLYGIGRVVNHLQRHGLTYAEISKQTGVAKYLLRKAKHAYLSDDRRTVTAKSRVEGLTKASTTKRSPTDATLVNQTMMNSASHEIDDLLKGGMTVAHIARVTGLDRQTVTTAGKRPMTWETYKRIMLSVPDLKGDLKYGFGTQRAARRKISEKTRVTKLAKRRSRLKTVMEYLKENPEAKITDVSRDLGIDVPALTRLRNREPKLASAMPSRLEVAREREAAVSRMLDENPSLRCIDVQRELGLNKNTAHSMLNRVRASRAADDGHEKDDEC